MSNESQLYFIGIFSKSVMLGIIFKIQVVNWQKDDRLFALRLMAVAQGSVWSSLTFGRFTKEQMISGDIKDPCR